MTEISILAVVACFVLLWVRAARKLAADGKSWLVRNFMAAWIALAGGVLLAFLLLGDFNGWTIFGWLLVGGVIQLFRSPLPGDVAKDPPMVRSSGFALSPQAKAIYEADEPNEQIARWKDKAPRGAAVTIADIEFDYRDARGDGSHRRVEVEAVDREYFQGHCHKAGAERTFVIGRVRGKVLDLDSGELLAPKAWAAEARKHPLNDPARIVIGRDEEDDEAPVAVGHDAAIEICFTGFSKADKLRLEAMADRDDMIVRQSVTVGLTHLCTGPNAGPKKIEQATEVGAEIIDEAEFYTLYANT